MSFFSEQNWKASRAVIFQLKQKAIQRLLSLHLALDVSCHVNYRNDVMLVCNVFPCCPSVQNLNFSPISWSVSTFCLNMLATLKISAAYLPVGHRSRCQQMSGEEDARKAALWTCFFALKNAGNRSGKLGTRSTHSILQSGKVIRPRLQLTWVSLYGDRPSRQRDC